ncbi:MAG: hypothetical protein JXA57_07470 [Armatimonadetes bacterium]|nr:hypothetical protein [Armatimonadota bacterium]
MKTAERFWIPCLCAFALAVGFSFSASLRADLAAHWRLDEGEGSEFENKVDPDFNGYLQDATVSIRWVEVTASGADLRPHQDSAVEFLGANSWIQTDFPGIEGDAARTVAFWVKSTTTAENGIVGWGDAAASGRKWTVHINRRADHGPVGAIRTSCVSGKVVATTPINDGKWHHVACVFPEGGYWIGDVLQYVDGQLDPRRAWDWIQVDTAAGEPANPVTIGMTWNWNAVQGIVYRQFFSGAVADVRIYDHALEEKAIQEIVFGEPPVSPSFLRGNANADETTDLSDAVFILSYLFLGGPAPTCLDSGDCDDSGVLELTDAVYLLSHLFLGGPAPAEPFPACGPDPTPEDDLSCESFEVEACAD